MCVLVFFICVLKKFSEADKLHLRISPSPDYFQVVFFSYEEFRLIWRKHCHNNESDEVNSNKIVKTWRMDLAVVRSLEHKWRCREEYLIC